MRIRLGTLLLAGVALLPHTASGRLAACRADRETFCKGVPLGGGRVVRCLEQHAANLSDGCRWVLGTMAPGGGRRPSSAAQACHDDAVRLCRDSGGNRANLKACLHSHAAELSDGCKSALAAPKKD